MTALVALHAGGHPRSAFLFAGGPPAKHPYPNRSATMSEASESGSREQDEFFGTTDWMDGNGRRWTLWRGLVVECPSCGFTFGADHTNAMDENDPDGYSCPLCDLTARHIDAQRYIDAVIRVTRERDAFKDALAHERSLNDGVAARADRLTAFLEGMLDPKWWSEEVDVNGEYTSTRLRGYYDVAPDIRAALHTADSGGLQDSDSPAASPVPEEQP